MTAGRLIRRTLRRALPRGERREILLYGRRPTGRDFGREIVGGEAGNRVIREQLARGRPTLVTRLGAVELTVLNFFVRWRSRIPWASARPGYPADDLARLQTNAGFFPTTDRAADRFAALYLDSLELADVLGVWFLPSEHERARRCPNARLVQLESLDPVLHAEPWTAGLAGKRVLVIHPFAASIERQYGERRRDLFRNPETLPEFELQTLKAVQSVAGEITPFESWFDALDHMCEEIARRTYDVAIIGAGAYGLPLGAFVKRQGRQAVHLGGTTQILFGIIGRRWELDDRFRPLVNSAWVRPSDEERPLGHLAVEDSCYW